METGPAKPPPGKSITQIVAEFDAAGRPVSAGLRQQAEAEQSGDWAVMLGFERPSRQRRVEIYGKAIDPWETKEADEERRREGLRPIYFRGLRKSLRRGAPVLKRWVGLLWKPAVVGIPICISKDSGMQISAISVTCTCAEARPWNCTWHRKSVS